MASLGTSPYMWPVVTVGATSTPPRQSRHCILREASPVPTGRVPRHQGLGGEAQPRTQQTKLPVFIELAWGILGSYMRQQVKVTVC